MLILAFDTATEVATSALVGDGEVLGERSSKAQTLLADLDALLRQAGAHAGDVDVVAVGTGPGSFTGTRIGLSVARGLGLALDLRAAGISTLDALAAGAAAAGTAGATPVIDAKRGEVFVPGPRAIHPDELELPAGAVLVGDGARKYRAVFEERGFTVPADTDEQHVPRARFHALLAVEFGPVDEIEPIYVRSPDADKVLSVKLELRALDTADLDGVEQIEHESYPTPWSRAMFIAELAKGSSLCLGAYGGDGELAGYLIVSRYVDAWHVMNIAVDPKHRRRGVATALLERLFTVTADDEQRGYTLEVRVSNADAIRLYEQLGFVARGVRRGYYTDNREDAVIMWRSSPPLGGKE